MSDNSTTPCVIRLLAGEENLWNDYVRESSAASLYHLTGWKHVVERTFGHQTYYLYAAQQERIVGILPLVFLKSVLFGKFFVSMPFFNYGGLVAESDGIGAQLLDYAVTLAKQSGAEYIELRHLMPHDALCLPVKTSKVLMVLELPATVDELWNSFKSKLRSQIKRPEKEGFTVKFGQLDEVNSFYDVFVQNMHELGTPVYAKRLFENIVREFPDQAHICTVYDKEKPIASGFIIGFKDTLQIPWASSLRTYGSASPNMMLYWNILKFACEHGYKQFDFGRSTPDEGTYRFKEQWGAKPVPCYWHYWLSSGNALPELNPHNPKFRLKIRLWKKLPLSMTRLLGPHIVKYLP